MSVAPESGRNRIMIYGPKNDGTYVVEFKTADGEALAISVPVGETRVLKHFQERMPCWHRPEMPRMTEGLPLIASYFEFVRARRAVLSSEIAQHRLPGNPAVC
jgi:hypothetical protein